MSAKNSELIAELKSRLDLADVVSRYVKLQSVGSRLMGPCPFHQETKASFSVSPELGLYHCFGCQASGDLIDFYCRINGLDFVTGLQEPARGAGLEFKKDASPKDKKKAEIRRLCLEMHSLAQAYFRSSLAGNKSAEARSYLQQRGISSELVELFGLGWSPDSWQGLKSYLQEYGYAAEQGVQAGLLSQSARGRAYDRFRGRITFPITDLSGKVVAFGGRIIGEGEPKYLNSSDSPIYKKGDYLYGLYQARSALTKSKEALLTEGYADVISLFEYGFTNSCGVLGTALTFEQVRRLTGFCKRINLVFDGDRAGREAARRSAQLILRQGITARVVHLPEGEDVDSFLRQNGKEALVELIDKAEDGLAFCLRMLKLESTPKDILQWAHEFLNGLNDSTWQAYYLPKLASGLGLSENNLRQSLRSKRNPGPKREVQQDSSSAGKSCKSLVQRDRELLAFAICCPQYIPQLKERGLADILSSSRARDFWNKLVQHDGQDVLQYLDEGEKKFYVQSQFISYENGEAEAIWEDICHLIQVSSHKQRQKSLREALSKARLKGDKSEEARLLKAYTQSLGGSNE